MSYKVFKNIYNANVFLAKLALAKNKKTPKNILKILISEKDTLSLVDSARENLENRGLDENKTRIKKSVLRKIILTSLFLD